ncbi:peptidoglycan-binding protein [Desulfatiferula olefinivorans]
MALEKAVIQRYDPDTLTVHGEAVPVLFNPGQYRLSKSNRFVETAVPGLSASLIQFGQGNGRVLTMQLFFDTYEERTDVREHTDRITGLLDIDPELHAPPVCVFSWGDLNFVSVLERAEMAVDLFLPSGVPVRATLDVTFKEYFDGRRHGANLQSANFAKRYVVRRGDTLSGISGRVYDDPGYWRFIAEENRIDDPLSIVPGQVLVIPAIE